MDWLVRMQQAAEQAPRRPRLPLLLAGTAIGSAEEELLRTLAAHAVSLGFTLLHETPAGWVVPAGPDHAGLAALARCLRELGLAGPWRDELLAVRDEQGQCIARIERAAVRPLGIATHAVHLVGLTPGDGRMWVQQRAFDKADAPGQWDTLMGGMVAADDTLESALARETWEEAGLELRLLRALRHGGRIRICQPTSHGGGSGYCIEHIDWYTAVVPHGLAPVNLDGEVEQFELLERAELQERLQSGAFTLEASLILAAALALT